MKLSKANSHFIKALDNYNFGKLSDCIEQIEYTLSNNNDHAGAHYLLGRVSEEYAYDYNKAKELYLEAIRLDSNFHPTYLWYIDLLIELEDYVEAKKIIDLAFTVVSVDNSYLNKRLGQIHEKKEEFEKAREMYKEASYKSINDSFRESMSKAMKRCKRKKEKRT